MKLILSDRPLDLSIHSDDIVFVDLSACTIANCIGCFGCWTKTPGKCVIRDDATTIYPLIAKSDEVIYISRVKYGGYDTTMKTMLERAIPVQQAFIRIHNGETHHVQRAVVPKKAIIIAYDANDCDERALFEQLVARNAHNMNFKSHRVVFARECDVQDIVTNEVKKWEKSCS